MVEITALVLNSKDNVANAITIIECKTTVYITIGEDMKKIIVKQNIPLGHKFAIKTISKGEEIIKYGEIIGKSTSLINKGEHVHVHNVESIRGRGDISK